MEIIIYTKPNCSHCDELKVKLDNLDVPYISTNIMTIKSEYANSIRNDAKSIGQRMMPIVYINGEIVRPEEVIERISR